MMSQPNSFQKAMDCAPTPFFYSPKGEDAEDREVQRDNQWMYFQIHHWMNGQICTIIHLTTIIHWLHLHSCAKTWSWLDSRTMVANQ